METKIYPVLSVSMSPKFKFYRSPAACFIITHSKNWSLFEYSHYEQSSVGKLASKNAEQKTCECLLIHFTISSTHAY